MLRGNPKEKAKRKVNKYAVKQLVNILKRGLSDYEFDEIVAAVPPALDLFSDDQIDELISAIIEYHGMESDN